MAFNFADLFEHAVDATPDRVAVVVGDLHLTYADLDERVNRLAHHLSDHGIGAGDHVGIYGLNSAEWIESMLAAFKLRAVPININYRYVTAELAYLFSHADLTALIHDQAFGPLVADALDALPMLRHVVVIDDGSDAEIAEGSVTFEEAVASGRPDRGFADRTGDEHYIIFTGGTTGMPKGVVWRHEDVFFALGGGFDAVSGEPVADDRQLAEKGASGPPMVSLCAPPLMHGAAQFGSLRPLTSCGTVVYVPNFDPVEVWETVERERVNGLMIVGDAMARPLLEALAVDVERWDLSSLVVIGSSAVAFSPPVKQRFVTALPQLIISDAIGSTETGHNGTSVRTSTSDAAPVTEGLGVTVEAMPGTVVLDGDLRPVVPGSGVVGLLARSGNVPLGYYKDDAKTAATFVTAPDGVRYAMPGDFARVEANGSITLLGRGSVSINSGGEKIYPEEVEGAVKTHPAVLDAIVVGAPDERWGSIVTALVALRPGHDAPSLEQLADHCRASVARYKVPRRLVVVDEVRRSPSGKPDYPWATELATQAAAPAGA
jgi:acyl-CoA synthetase (AMP-forming)/AMP-acid ligase II